MRQLTTVDDGYAPVLAAISDRAAGAAGTFVVGITGGVGVGKSTAAALLRSELAARSLSVDVICTDGFLLPNADLETRRLLSRKGFPETFDDVLLIDVLGRVRRAEFPVGIPEYSHLTYDRVDGDRRLLGRSDVVIVEGVNALQSPVVEHVDLGIYLETDEESLRTWFTDRFLALCAEADADPGGGSFYCAFLDDTEDERRETATSVWDKVNAVNLRRHIAPSRAAASYVVVKDSGHRVVDVIAGG